MLGPKRPFWPSSPVVARFWGKPEGRSRVYQPTHHLYKMVGTLANTRPCPQRHHPHALPMSMRRPMPMRKRLLVPQLR